MRQWTKLAWLGLWMGVGSLAAAETTFPYTAYVQSSSTSVLAGASIDSLATGRLKQGDQVQVYRHQGDWAGIRPPHSSFSWVAGDRAASGSSRK